MRFVRHSIPISRSVRYLWSRPDAVRGYRAAVSLHSHTMHSREGLDFIPRVLRRVAPAHAILEKCQDRFRREHGKPIPFHRASWRPPLHPHAAHDLEAAQIHDLLNLRALVSLTDHDTLEACAELNTIGIGVPYSLEWTVPYHGTVFHIGVHNLPPDQARALESAMAAVTADPRDGRIAELLAAMHAMAGVLLILNHPFSCEELMERAGHVRLLQRFLAAYGPWLHAYELNGLQPPVNNSDTIRLAAESGVPVISGGDRHCCEPNANVNLTNAATFAEFVDEVRIHRRSTVLFLPQYRDPISVRYIEFIWHAVRDYPDFHGRVRWTDRVFFQRDNGETVTVASLWGTGGPALIRSFIAVIGFLASPGIRAMHCRAVGRAGLLEPEGL